MHKRFEERRAQVEREREVKKAVEAVFAEPNRSIMEILREQLEQK